MISAIAEELDKLFKSDQKSLEPAVVDPWEVLSYFDKELRKKQGVTNWLLWEEYFVLSRWF
jgi:hypothetical protein